MPVGGPSHYNQGSATARASPERRTRAWEDGRVKTSVIVVDWHRPELTDRCLRAVFAQEGVVDVEVVLVAKEAPPEEAERWRALHPGLLVAVEAENVGFAAGVQRGLSTATGEVVVLVNNDAVPEPGFLAAGLRALSAGHADVVAAAATVVLEGRFRPARPSDDPTGVLVGLDGARWDRDADGVQLLNGTGDEMTRQGNGHDRDWLGPLVEGAAEHDRDPFGFSGGAAFLRRDAVDAVGGFDPALFMYYEDLDLAWRLRLAGGRIVHVPDAVVVHRHAGSSDSGSTFVRYQSMRNRLAVVLRNGTSVLVLRVLLRTAGRFAEDLLLPDARRHLPAHRWRQLARALPGLVTSALRHRRADAVARDRRLAVESLLVPGPR